jgi:hypothetical protein
MTRDTEARRSVAMTGAQKARKAFIEAQAEKLVARTGTSEKAARQVIVRQFEGVLRPDIVLPFDDPELASCTVGDVLANPEFYDCETLVDPLEGVNYGPAEAACLASRPRRVSAGRAVAKAACPANVVRQNAPAAGLLPAGFETSSRDEVWEPGERSEPKCTTELRCRCGMCRSLLLVPDVEAAIHSLT